MCWFIELFRRSGLNGILFGIGKEKREIPRKRGKFRIWVLLNWNWLLGALTSIPFTQSLKDALTQSLVNRVLEVASLKLSRQRTCWQKGKHRLTMYMPNTHSTGLTYWTGVVCSCAAINTIPTRTHAISTKLVGVAKTSGIVKMTNTQRAEATRS